MSRKKDNSQEAGVIAQVLIEDRTVFHHALFGGPSGRIEPQNQVSLTAFRDRVCELHEGSKTVSYGLAPCDLRVRDLRQQNGLCIVLVEVEPLVRTMQWLTDDSPAHMGEEATYKPTQLAFPWQYFFIPMDRDGNLQCCSVYFRRTPIENLRDCLLDCSYYNCSPDSYGYHCWICNQYFNVSVPNPFSFFKMAGNVIDFFLWGKFNQSSETHEGDSFWSRTKRDTQDENLKTTGAWEAASKNSGIEFAVQAGWLESGMTPEAVYDDLAKQGSVWQPESSREYAAVVDRLAAETKRRKR